VPEEKDFMPAEIYRQAKVALEEADAIIMVVDARTELAAPDIDLARQLIRGGKPLFLAVNKVDTEKQQRLTDEFHRLGIRKLFPVSAEHGRGLDDLLDAIFETLKLETSNPEPLESAEAEIKEEAAIALLVIDATEGVSALDAAIAGYADESGRSLIIIVNKWDLVIAGNKSAARHSKAARMRDSKRPADRSAYEQRVRDALKFLNYAPVLFVSAATGNGTE